MSLTMRQRFMPAIQQQALRTALQGIDGRIYLFGS